MESEIPNYVKKYSRLPNVCQNTFANTETFSCLVKVKMRVVVMDHPVNYPLCWGGGVARYHEEVVYYSTAGRGFPGNGANVKLI